MQTPAADAPRPLVSVVIPSFDTAELARGAVASVLAQTRQDFEILLVDDGSRPEHIAILEALAGASQGASAPPGQGGARSCAAPRLEAGARRDRRLPRRRRSLRARVSGSLSRPPRRAAGARRRLHPLPHARPAGRAAQHPAEAEPCGRIFAREVAKSTVKTSTLMVRRASLLALANLVERTRSGGNYDLILRLAYTNEFGFLDEVLVDVIQRPGSFSKDLSRRHLDRSEILENLLRMSIPTCPGPSATRFAPRSGSTCSRPACGKRSRAPQRGARSAATQLRVRRSPRAVFHFVRG